MHEFSSVTASLHDAEALAPLLTERAAEGWEVVAIIAAAPNVVAYLQREGSGLEADTTADATDDVAAPADAAVGWMAGSAAAAAEPDADADAEPEPDADAEPDAEAQPADETEPAVDETEPAAAEPEPAGDDSVASLAAQVGAADAAGDAMQGESAPYVPIADEPVAEPAAEPVVAAEDEPAGWAVAPEPEPEPAAAEPAAAEPAGEPAAAAEPAAEPAAAEPAAAESTVPAGWYADPSTRYELRYWDGTAWTEHVSRAGQQYTDPPVA